MASPVPDVGVLGNGDGRQGRTAVGIARSGQWLVAAQSAQ